MDHSNTNSVEPSPGGGTGRDAIRVIIGGMSLMGVVSTLIAGIMGVPIMLLLGSPLAMGAAIWSGRTTEPMVPDAPYPWLATGLALAVALVGLVVEHRGQGAVRWGARVLSWVGALWAFALPFLYLHQLWALT